MIRDVDYRAVVQLLEKVRTGLTDCICELMVDDVLQLKARDLKLKVIELQDECRCGETADVETKL